MLIPLRLLILEDHAVEAELMAAELRRSGLDPQWTRVDSEPEFRASLVEDWDLILADFSLPQFSALDALKVLADARLAIPVIVVTGAVGEEVAAECIKQGATDYLLKDRLTRLPSAVTQALEQRRVRDERTSAQRDLRESEARFRALVEHSSNGMVLVNSSGHVLHRYNDLFPNRPDDNWYQDSFFEWMIVEDRPAVLQLWDRLPEGIQTTQFRISDRRGGVRWLEAVCNDLRATPRVEAIVAHYRDVTKRRELEGQLRHSQKMQAVGQLAAGLGHDFNNLLTIICGHADVLLEHTGLSNPLQQGLTEIQGACRRATRLARNLLTFSRKKLSEPKVVDLNCVVSDLIPLLRSLLGKEFDFRSNLEDGVALVHIDEGELEQVIMNLVVNARDATPASGSITLETHTIKPNDPLSLVSGSGNADPQILLSVKDTGSGMDSETLARIFEPFFTTKDVGKGTGLGLSTVYAIVNNSGGRISAESQIGQGSTFHMLLPRVQGSSSPASIEDALSARRSGNETILLVEDGDSIRELIVTILEPLGYRLVVARDAAEAIQCWRSATTPIDLLITDVRMPGSSGPELGRMLRKEQPALKVLFVSGCTDLEEAGANGLAGASLLTKPFSREMLMKKVRNILDASGTGQSACDLLALSKSTGLSSPVDFLPRSHSSSRLKIQ